MKDKNPDKDKNKIIPKDDLSNVEDESGDEGVSFICLEYKLCYI